MKKKITDKSVEMKDLSCLFFNLKTFVALFRLINSSIRF